MPSIAIVAEYQVTYWRELPSLVVARDGEDQAKVALPSRFQEAVDEAAMRLGEVSADAYLDGWRRTEWTPGDGPPARLAAEVARGLEDQWPVDVLNAYVASLGPTETPS